MQNVKYPEFKAFIISLIISLFVLLFLSYLLYSSNTIQSIKYTDDQNAYMDIYFDEENDLNQAKNQEKSEYEPIKEKEVEEKKQPEKVEEKKEVIKPKEVVKNNQNISNKVIEDNKTKEKETDLDQLFSQIDDDKLKNIEKNSDLQLKSSKDQTQGTNNQENKGGKTQRTGVYNKFLGSVEKKLTAIWRSYRAVSDEGIIEITINPNGKLTAKIVKLSYNTEFNLKLRDYIERIENESFPTPPDGTSFIKKYRLKDKLVAQE